MKSNARFVRIAWKLIAIAFLVMPRGASAQPATQPAAAIVMPSIDEPLPYGTDFDIPDATRRNATSPRTVELLGKAFTAGETVPRRVELVRDIGACELPIGLEFLATALGEPDPLVRAEAARSIAVINDPSILPKLRERLNDEDPMVRREVIVAGGKLKDEAIVLQGLASDDMQVLVAAMNVSFSPAHADAIAGRLPKLEPTYQTLAIRALGRLVATKHANAVEDLMDSVPHKTAGVQALALMKSTGHSDEVQSLLADPHPTIRREAMLALAGVATPEVQQARAIERLADEVYPVRTAAAYVLIGVPTPAAVDALVLQLDVDFQPLHETARNALVAVGQGAVPAAVKLLDNANPKRRIDGLFVLMKLKSDAALERQIALMKDPDWFVVAAAARSLGAAGRKEAIPVVAALARTAPDSLKDTPSDQIEGKLGAVTASIIACGQLGHGDVLPVLMPLVPQFETQPADYRAATAWLWGVAGNPDDGSSGTFLATVGNPKDFEGMKFESIKAVGNARHRASAGTLNTWLGSGDVASNPRLRWITHWSHDRINGTLTPYAPPVWDWKADVTIMDDPAQ